MKVFNCFGMPRKRVAKKETCCDDCSKKINIGEDFVSKTTYVTYRFCVDCANKKRGGIK